MQFPKIIEKIFDIFEKNGSEIFLVGGASRSFILGSDFPKDVDFSTNALPDKIINILNSLNGKILLHAVKYGTVTCLIHNFNIEITSTRSDIECFGREAKVIFCDSFFEDSNRRDFTINAIYVGRKGKILDFHNGINDLKKNSIRFIGKPEQRIKEDYLRILRYFRFAGVYSFPLDIDVINICKKMKYELKSLSIERINMEINKILSSKNYLKTILNLIESGVLDFIFPKILPEGELTIDLDLNSNVIKFIYIIVSLYKIKAPEILASLIRIGFFLKKDEKNQINFFIKNFKLFFDKSELSIQDKILIFDNSNFLNEYNFLSLIRNQGKREKALFLLKNCKKIDLNLSEEQLKKMNGLEIKQLYEKKKIDFINSIYI